MQRCVLSLDVDEHKEASLQETFREEQREDKDLRRGRGRDRDTGKGKDSAVLREGEAKRTRVGMKGEGKQKEDGK